MASSCHREKVILVNQTHFHRAKSEDSDDLQSFLPIANLEPYKLSMQGLTFGFLHLDNFFSPTDVETNWPRMNQWLWESFLSKLTYTASYQICDFACTHSTFIHQGIVPELYMQDHDEFWARYASNNANVLKYWESNIFLNDQPTDYYYWMSLYYIILANGLTFGRDDLSHSNIFGADTEQIITNSEILFNLFKSSIACLYRTDFMLTPDIRSVQIYCCLSLNLQSFGTAHLDTFLLQTIIGIAKSLKLDKIGLPKKEEVNFHNEIGKRLWHTLCIIDWLTHRNRNACSIQNSECTPPRLITYDQLLGKQSLTKIQMDANELNILEYKPDPRIFTNLLYLRYMFEVSKIRKLSYDRYPNGRNLNHCLRSLIKLEKTFQHIFDSFDLQSNDADTINYDHIRYIMTSSCIQEMLDIYLLLLAVVGRKEWSRKYRSKAVKLALNQIESVQHKDVPSYFKVHWIIVLHLMYASTFLFIDMLAFTDNVNIDRLPHKYIECYNTAHKLTQIKSVLPFIEKLKDLHVTARVGYAVIQKMLVLVSSLKQASGPSGENTIEGISVKKFLSDLKIGSITNSRARPGVPLGHSQYLRVNKVNNIDNPYEGFRQEQISQREDTRGLLNPQYNDMLADTGWIEFLNFFYGNGNDLEQYNI